MKTCIACKKTVMYSANGLCEDCISKRVTIKTVWGESFSGLLVRGYPVSNIAVVVLDGSDQATRFDLDVCVIV
jgi:hypothetical protein